MKLLIPASLLLLLPLLVLSQTSPQIKAPEVPIYGIAGPAGPFPFYNHGVIQIADADYTMAYPDMSAEVLRITSSVPLTAQRTIIAPPDFGFEFTVENATTGGFPIVFRSSTAGVGTGAVIPSGQAAKVMSDGTNYVVVGNVVAPQNATFVLAGPPLSANPIPPTIVQSNICTSIVGSTATCTFTNPTKTNSLIIVGTPYQTTTVSDNLGQTYLTSPNFPFQSTFWREGSVAGVTSVTASVPGPGAAIVLLEVSQIATSGSLDQDLYNDGNITGINTPITWSIISSSNPADFVIGLWTCAQNSTTTPTAVTGWTIGGYQAAPGNGWSGGFVWQNGTAVQSFQPQIATANCPTQQYSHVLAFKANLVGSIGPTVFRPLQASDLPPRPWSSITNPPPDYLLQLNMGTGATVMDWNLAATNTVFDYGFGISFGDTSQTNPSCLSLPLPDTPSCRYTVGVFSNQPGVWPLWVDAEGGSPTDAHYFPGFHVAGDTGNIVMQVNSTIQIPSIPNASRLGTDANGNIIAATGTAGGGISPAAQFTLPYYNTSGTGSTLAGATGITVDSTQTVLNAQNGITTGAAPPTNCGGTATGCLAMAETGSSTWGTPGAGVDILQADVATHSFLMSLNGAAFTSIGGGGMVWPTSGPSIAVYNGSNAWTTGYSATNQIPFNYLNTSVPLAGTCTAGQYQTASSNTGPTCSQVNYSQLTGTVPNAPTATALSTNGTASQVWSMDSGGTTQGWHPPASNVPTYPRTIAGTVNSGGIPYATSTTTEAYSGTLGVNQVVLGGGAGASPTTTTELGYLTGSGVGTLGVGATGGNTGVLQLNGTTSGNFTITPSATSNTVTLGGSGFTTLLVPAGNATNTSMGNAAGYGIYTNAGTFGVSNNTTPIFLVSTAKVQCNATPCVYSGLTYNNGVTFQSGLDTASTTLTAGPAIFKSASMTGGTIGGGNTGSATLQAGDNAATGGASQTVGNTIVTSGGFTGASGAATTWTSGYTQIQQKYWADTTVTTGTLACYTTPGTSGQMPRVGTCTVTSNVPWIGVIVGTQGQSVIVEKSGHAAGVVSNASATDTAGYFVCVDTTNAGKVTVGTTVCGAGLGVGIIDQTGLGTTAHSVDVERF